MAISPFSARPASPDNEGRRARLLLAIALIGIGATLLAYAISPGVRHAVSHAAHSVKGAVTRVLHGSRKHRTDAASGDVSTAPRGSATRARARRSGGTAAGILQRSSASAGAPRKGRAPPTAPAPA